jgi:diguanylate cyclase (GGDEF)-like protein/PAS domain S-box-containing protein
VGNGDAPPESARDTGRLLPVSRERLEDLIDNVPAIVYIAEMGESGRWHYISPQVRDLLGYEPDEWMADRGLWYSSIHPDDKEHALSFEDEIWIGDDAMPPAEYRLRTKDGHYVWVLEQARLVADENGGPTLWHGVMLDITALKRAHEDLSSKARQQALTARLGEAAIRIGEQDELFTVAIDGLLEMDRVIEAEIWEQNDFGKIHLRHRSNRVGPPITLDFEPDRYPGSEIARGRTVHIADWDNDARMAPYAKYRNPAVASSIIVPIAGTQKQFGFLTVNSSVANRFSEKDEDFLRAATSLIGSAIDRGRVEKSLRHRLLHDPLTELPNREFFTERLEEAIVESRATGRMMATLFLDIDHFKLINDGISHHVGDETLREVGRRLLGAMRPGDTVARFGGDEFGIVIRSIEGPSNAVAIGGRLLELLNSPIQFENSEIVISASIGVAVSGPENGRARTAGALLREADSAMHKAKNMGRAQTRLFDEPLRNRALSRLDTERGLRSAIEGDELVVYHQPFISLPGRGIVGFEALVRWRHAERGLLEPSEFIPVAEESGLITRIDTWVLEEAIRQTAIWDSIVPGDKPFSVSANSSARQLGRAQLPELVTGLLEQYGLPPQRIALEITETTLISAASTAGDVLNALSGIGIGLALDDFGMGFSSLSYLGKFPLDVIRIDRTFIEQLTSGDPTGYAIAEAIVQIGNVLKMTVVAEGVSDEAQLRTVLDLGCRVLQGYLISEPVPADRASDLLEQSLAHTTIQSGVDT